jgi:hypothetical protein
LRRAPLTVVRDYARSQTSKTPDISIIEFVTSDAYLNRPTLYPRQATLLKVMFLEEESLTQYDYDVIGEWGEGFTRIEPDLAARERGEMPRYEGLTGIVPDVLERMKRCRDEGRRWMREVVSIIGRRGSKGYIGALATSRVLWHYVNLLDPQDHYGLPPGKNMAAFVFGGKKEQAKANQWKDIRDVVVDAPCFTPYIGRDLAELLTVRAPNDNIRDRLLRRRGLQPPLDSSTFLIEPRESTPISARGPAAFVLVFDEMAHVVKGAAKAEASIVYGQAKPALDQFGLDSFIYEGSSTWQMSGQFYENYLNTLTIDPDTNGPLYYDMVTWQLTSWDPYIDWDIAHHLRISPDSKATFAPIKRPMQEWNSAMEREEKANPETFAVERRSRWAAVQGAYLNQTRIDEAFGDWDGTVIHHQTQGLLSREYYAHGDPSKSNANFGFAIGHTEGPDDDGLLHVVFDVVHAWLPSDFEDHRVLYVGPDSIEESLWDYIERFNPVEMTFDQFNSVAVIQSLTNRVATAGLPRRTQVYERTATASLNWQTYEVFKSALNMGLVHIPEHELAKLELMFLIDKGNRVEHPTTGTVQTKDVADCLAIVTHHFLCDQMLALKALSAGSLRGGLAGGTRASDRSVETSVMDALRGRPVPQQGLSPSQRSNRGSVHASPRSRSRG